MVVQRFDLLIHGVFDAQRGGLCDVEVAEELHEAISGEGVGDVRLPPLALPVQVEVRQLDDTHEDVDSNEAPHLRRCRGPTRRCLLESGVQVGVGGDGVDEGRREEALEIAQLGRLPMTREDGAGRSVKGGRVMSCACGAHGACGAVFSPPSSSHSDALLSATSAVSSSLSEATSGPLLHGSGKQLMDSGSGQAPDS